jgi:Flp pilus assembly protein TadB
MDCPCLLTTVSLANALVCVNSLETKLKATTKALKEANKKHAKEVAAAKLSANQAVKEGEARATKAEKALAEVSQRQASREEDVVKWIDDILTCVGSKWFVTFVFYCLPLCRHVFLLVVFFVM